MTPVIAYEGLSLKLESRQPGGSYKMRGIRAFLEAAPSHLRDLEVLSAGNMARSLAIAGREHGCRVRAFVPDSIPEVKRRALEALDVRLEMLPFADLWARVEEPRHTLALVHPVDTPELLRGYGTLADELLAEQPELGRVVIPFGVGGLCLGLAFALKRLRPSLRIIVVENALAAPLSAALATKDGIPIHGVRGWIDAIGTPRVLPRVLQALSSGRVPALGDAGLPLVDEVLRVDPEAARAEGRRLLHLRGELIEGAAAVALAAARGLPAGLATAVIITGSNVSAETYA
jgi:threonine dehydratase